MTLLEKFFGLAAVLCVSVSCTESQSSEVSNDKVPASDVTLINGSKSSSGSSLSEVHMSLNSGSSEATKDSLSKGSPSDVSAMSKMLKDKVVMLKDGEYESASIRQTDYYILYFTASW